MLRLLAVALAAVPGLALAQTISVQEALLRAKPAVAVVVTEVAGEVTLHCPGGEVKVTPDPVRETGTGWFVTPDGWVITNAHVVSLAHRPPQSVTSRLADRAARPGCRPGAVALDPSISVVLSNGFRLPARVAKYSPPVAGEEMSGQDLALLRLEAADMPSLALGDSTAARIGDPLHVVGFPGVVLAHELLNATARVEASVTTGAISGFKQDRAGQPVIQTDAPAAWGNSGGPALDHQGRVIGVLTFVTLSGGDEGGIVQGFNFVIPVQTVREFLEGAGVDLAAPSRFNQAWHAALRDFFAGRHARAAAALEEANRLMPELPDVRRLTAENEELIRNPPPTPFPWRLALGIAAAAAGAVAAALVAARRRRNRFRIRPAEVKRLLDGPEPPVILDVRDAATYERSPVRIPDARHVPPETLESGDAGLDIPRERTVVAYCT